MRSKSQKTLDAILKFVNKYYQQNRKAPSIIDVADGVGVGKTTAYRYLQELSERGLLEYSRGIAAAPKSAKMKTAYVSAPLVGSIQCGCPEEEQEMVEEYVSLPVSMFGNGEFYILRAKGDSILHQAKESLAFSAHGRRAMIFVFRLTSTCTKLVSGNLFRHALFT